MMFRLYSLFRSGSKTALLLPLMALLALTFCSKKTDYSDIIPGKMYFVPELTIDANRSEELGIPITLFSRYTSSGELFTGTQKIYHIENDSLITEHYFKDGLHTGSLFKRDGNINRIVHGIYLNKPLYKELYVNGNLVYQNIPPTESEDGMGHARSCHRNGQLGYEITYIGDQVFNGLGTEYDEEGNIINQEWYEDGELVEKIE